MQKFLKLLVSLGLLLFAELAVTSAKGVDSCASLKTRPRGCEDIQLGGQTDNGIYTIYPDEPLNSEGIQVFCDLETDEGGWVVIQRQIEAIKGSLPLPLNFDRTYLEYVAGFGRMKGSFWLGLYWISKLTKDKDKEVRFDLWDWEGESRYAQYSFFHVDSPVTSYKLSISGHSGNLEDEVSYNDGMAFTTFDVDNDNASINCAGANTGGWWYNACMRAHPTGKYNKTNHVGIKWNSWHGVHYSMKRIEMKIRNREFKQAKNNFKTIC